MIYSNTQLRTLAQQNPKELIRIITSANSETHTVAAGIEALGEESSNEALVVPALRQLLKHPHALVREGALNGVAAFFADKEAPRDVVDRLRAIAKSDPLPTNKDIASDIISAFDKK